MSGGIGRRLKAAAVYLLIFAILIMAFTGAAAGKASARASLKAYLTAGPNTWEMMGFNQTGTAAKFVVDHQGWNVSRTFGNVGIGDGSVRALNLTSNVNDIGYTENNFMAGDVSTAPWDPGRIKDFSIAEENLPKSNESANVSHVGPRSAKLDVADNETPAANASEQEAGQEVEQEAEHETEQETTAEAGVSFGNNALSDPFHSILLGRPVGDLWYEHPHGISANMYSRLVGLRLPGGTPVTIGMRAIGYGY